MASTSRQVGQALGVALAGSILGVAAGAAGARAWPRPSHPVWWLVAGTGAVVLALGMASTSAWARRTAADCAALLSEDAGEPSQAAPVQMPQGPSIEETVHAR